MAALASNANFTKRRKHRPIVLVGGDKGGVGKSFGARAVTGWLAMQGYQVAAFDADGRNPHLARYYDNSLGVSQLTLRETLGWTCMYKTWELVDDNCVIIVDLPGNIGAEVAKEATRLKLISERLNRDLINVWVAAEEEDSIWLLGDALQVADAHRTIFWMNGRFGADSSKFELWNDSQKRSNFISDGGIESFLPVLPIYARTAIARARAPFHNVSSANLGFTDRIDFDLWWTAVDESLKPLSDLLGGRP